MPNKNQLSFSFTSTIKDIPPQIWDELFGKEIIEGYGYHRTLEESGLKEFDLRYLLVKRGENIAAIVPFFITDFSLATIVQGPLQKFILAIQKTFRRFLKLKLIFIGFPTCEELYIGVSKDENLAEILCGALKALDDVCRKEKAKMLLFYNLSEKHKPIAEFLTKQKFARMASFPNTSLKITANSLEEYINGLGKNTRKDIRRKLRNSLNKVVLTTEIVENIDNTTERIHELYMANFTDSKVHFEVLTPEFFRSIPKNMPQEAKFFLTRDKEKIVAFNLLLIKNGVVIDKFVGFDKGLASEYSLYFTTFCFNMDYCVKNGIHSYQLGVTDYEPKLRLGARLVPLTVYLKMVNPFLNIFSGLAALLSPVRFDPTLKKINAEAKLPGPSEPNIP